MPSAASPSKIVSCYKSHVQQSYNVYAVSYYINSLFLKIKVSWFGSVLMFLHASQVIFTLIYFWSFEPFFVLKQHRYQINYCRSILTSAWVSGLAGRACSPASVEVWRVRVKIRTVASVKAANWEPQRCVERWALCFLRNTATSWKCRVCVSMIECVMVLVGC